MNPVVRMAAVSGACWLVVSLILGSQAQGAVPLGMLGPLAAAIGTWVIVERTYAKSPERLSAVMLQLFAAKFLLFAAYVASAVILLPGAAVAFVVSFTSQYITLHLMEAVYLRRLFAVEGRRVGVN